MSSVCVTRGRPTWVVGLKRTLFESAAPEWQAARDKGHRSAGVFYDNFTKRFIATFGWNFDIWTDKDCPIATEEQWQCIDDHTGLDVAEISKRQKYAKWLRTVSDFCRRARARTYVVYRKSSLGSAATTVGSARQTPQRTSPKCSTGLLMLPKPLAVGGCISTTRMSISSRGSEQQS